MNKLSENGELLDQLGEVEQRYRAHHPLSAKRHETACSHFPGGSTRSAIFYTPFPLTWVRGLGNRLVDLDGLDYADFLGEYSAALYGHSNPTIQAAISKVVEDGMALGGPNVYEAQLAAAIRERFPSMELLRFTNSGTEANLMALSTVRALEPSKKRLMVFNGAYHGGVFYFRSGQASLNIPFDWVVASYNAVEPTRALLREHAAHLAGVIVEPMLGGGCLAGTPEFLGMLREECSAHHIPLIFDEVMTSRLSPSGAQGLLGIVPDLTTMGKYLGGGASFGAFGGRRDILSRFDPGHPHAFEHAGTFNNNIISMAAGLAGLTKVFTPAAAHQLNALGDSLRSSLNTMADRLAIPFKATGMGSLIGLHFAHADSDVGAEKTSMVQLQALFHLALIERGFYFGRRGYVALSMPTTSEDCAAFAAAVEDFLVSHRRLIHRTVHADEPGIASGET